MQNALKCTFLAFISLFIMSCAANHLPQPYQPIDLSTQLNTGKYKKKIDNFLVLFDASASMSNSYKQEEKFAQAKFVAHNLNQTIPPLDMQSGIRVFGPRAYCLKDTCRPLYGMTRYSPKEFSAAMAKITCTGGLTPLPQAINMASKDLTGTNGPIAVILISDAEDVDSASVEAANAMKSEYQDRVCIYPILIGDAPGSREIMDQIALAGKCGFATDYEALNSPQGMADFVKKVFLEKDMDSDGDGVYDSVDRCPNTPLGTKVDKDGCPVKVDQDSDHDGVLDSVDRCPNTPEGVKVDAYGCPIKVDKDSDHDGVLDSVDRCPDTPLGIKVDKEGCPLPIELKVEFNYNKYTIRPQYKPELEKFAHFLKSYPNLTADLEGHTDNIGSMKYNLELSRKRAESVKQYLIEKFNINPARLTITGQGFNKPIASNKTEAGRQRNRRVFAILSTKKN